MPAPFIEAQKLEPSARVHLFEVDTSIVGGPVHRFTTSVPLGQTVSFGGVQFVGVPIKVDGMTISGTGALQTPSMTISNSDGLIQEILNTFGDLEGSTVRRWTTFARHLDNGESPDPTLFYGPDVFVIDHKASDTPEAVRWELSALVDRQNVYIGRTVIRSTCMWRYRFWNPAAGAFDYTKAKCPYTGTAYFNEMNESVTDPALDRPSRNLDCCKLRFGEKNPLPFGGFPGVVRGI